VTNDRDSELVKKDGLTRQQGDTDRLTLQAQHAAVGVAQSNIEAQRALIRVLRQQKAYQSVIAPFDGIITQRNVDTGALVQAGSTFMFTLMQSDVIRTQVYVPQDAAFGVAVGVDAVVRIPENPDRTFPGKVTRFANALVPGTRTLLTEIDVPNPTAPLKPGLYVTVELQIPRKNPGTIVPADALVSTATATQVAVARDGNVQFHKVTVARDFGTEVEVRDGIKPGDEFDPEAAGRARRRQQGATAGGGDRGVPTITALTYVERRRFQCVVLPLMTAAIVLFGCGSTLAQQVGSPSMRPTTNTRLPGMRTTSPGMPTTSAATVAAYTSGGRSQPRRRARCDRDDIGDSSHGRRKRRHDYDMCDDGKRRRAEQPL